MKMFHPDADLFFEEPGSCHPPPSEYGVLYLLRRDIYRCLGVDPVTNKETCPTLWPGAMAIMAGIDLLAKFYSGSDALGEVGERFTEFIRRYFQPISCENADIIYRLRNSLLHSFGLYSFKGKQTYRFELTNDGAILVCKTLDGKYRIDLTALKERFEESVKSYAVELDNQPWLQCNFLKMFPKYGLIRISLSENQDED